MRANKTTRKKILIIENRFQSLEFLKRVLSSRYSILIAEDKNEGFNKAQSDNPDLIILNCKLYKERTLNLCAALKNGDKTKHIPLLMIAEKNDDSNVAEFYAQRVDGYLIKPFSGRDFLRQIQLVFNKGK